LPVSGRLESILTTKGEKCQITANFSERLSEIGVVRLLAKDFLSATAYIIITALVGSGFEPDVISNPGGISEPGGKNV
jgi:hypothetical protein